MIGLGEAARIHAELAWTRLRRGRLLWVCAALLALPIAGAGVLTAAGQWGPGLFDSLLELDFRFVVPFVPALLASTLIADELERRTATYLFSRPAPRASMVLGKYAAVAVPLAVGMAISIALTFAIAMSRDPGDLAGSLGHLARVEVAAVLGIFAYAALAAAVGALFPRHPFVAVVGYLLVVEAGIGSLPIVIDLVAIAWHLRNLADLPLPNAVLVIVHVPAWLSAVIAAGLGALCLGAASIAVTGAEQSR